MQAALLFSDLVPLVKHLVSGRLIFLNNLGILVYLCFPSFHEVFFFACPSGQKDTGDVHGRRPDTNDLLDVSPGVVFGKEHDFVSVQSKVKYE